MADTTVTTRAERLLVCIGPSPSSANLIRVAQKIAADLKAEWFAVCVEDPRILRLPETERSRASITSGWRNNWGRKPLPCGRHIAEEIVSFARQRNVTRIVVASPAAALEDHLSGSRWMNWCA